METYHWKQDPLLQNMDPQKLAFLTSLLEEAQTKKKEELMPFLLSLTSRANAQGFQFTDAETDLVLKVLKTNMTPEEVKRIDMVRRVTRMISRRPGF